jgi:Phosphomannose isomerase
MKHAEITNGEKLDLKNSSGFEIIKYPTPFSEFICYSVRITQSQTNTIDMTFETPSIVLAIKGEGIIKTKNTENKSYRETHIKEGQSFYILPCTSFHFGSHEAGLEVCICTSQVVSVD